MKIRSTTEADTAEIQSLVRTALPEEDLSALVDALLGSPETLLSAGAGAHGALTGQIFFTAAAWGTDDLTGRGALLGPLTVAPAYQRMGIGRQLVEYGAGKLALRGIERLFVLGDPAYYQRFGFAQEDRIHPPYPLAREWQSAWQSLALGPAQGPAKGTITLPQAFMDPALWSP